ncbi:MAG: c-type cytochrome [Bryobacteraceae bacterium]
MSVAMIGLALLPLHAQAPSSTKDGVFTADQAKRGDALYATHCASCHGVKYEGRNQAPPLAGPEFAMNWDGQPLSDLLEKMQTSMPGDKPGSLSARENADILAAMLRENGFPAGSAELPADGADLKGITFTAGK